GEKREPLPAAAELAHGELSQFFGNAQVVQNDIGPPAFIIAGFFVETIQHEIIECPAKQLFRHILADIADLQSTRPRDRAERRLALPDKETQETGLAAPVGSNETKALALAYDEIEISKKWLMKSKRKI